MVARQLLTASDEPRATTRRRAAPNVWVVVTCMGRLSFLKRTAPSVISCQTPGYCLVDYSCPDGCGDWIRNEFPQDCARGRIVVESVPGQRQFNKSAAFNAGARRALREGADYICFLDADTIVKPEFFDWLEPELAPNRFLIVELINGYDVPSLTGVLVVSAQDFAKSDGFDESFQGWGAEDIEFRLRLHMQHELSYGEIPLSLLKPIPHGDELRGSFYADTPRVSSVRNNSKMFEKMRQWRTTPHASRLLFQAGPVPERDPSALEQLVAVEPGNQQAVYRLAATYRFCRQFAKAEQTYKRRIAMGGWEEEVWCSIFELALTRLALGHPWDQVESTLRAAHCYRPHRAEPLWVLAAVHRELGKHAEAYAFAKLAVKIPKPVDVLAVDQEVYAWRALLEYAHAAWHLGKYDEALEANRRLLEVKTLPDAERERVLWNEACCAESLASTRGSASSYSAARREPSARDSTSRVGGNNGRTKTVHSLGLRQESALLGQTLGQAPARQGTEQRPLHLPLGEIEASCVEEALFRICEAPGLPSRVLINARHTAFMAFNTATGYSLVDFWDPPRGKLRELSALIHRYCDLAQTDRLYSGLARDMLSYLEPELPIFYRRGGADAAHVQAKSGRLDGLSSAQRWVAAHGAEPARLVAFGESNTFGKDLDQCELEREDDWYRQTHAYPYILAQHLGLEYAGNFARPGIGNNGIIRSLLDYVMHHGSELSNTFFLIGLAHPARKTFILKDGTEYLFINDHHVEKPRALHRLCSELFSSPESDLRPNQELEERARIVWSFLSRLGCRFLITPVWNFCRSDAYFRRQPLPKECVFYFGREGRDFGFHDVVHSQGLRMSPGLHPLSEGHRAFADELARAVDRNQLL